LSSSDAKVTVPSTVTVAAGQNSQTFSAVVAASSSALTATIHARLNGTEVTGDLSVAACVTASATAPTTPAIDTVWVDERSDGLWPYYSAWDTTQVTGTESFTSSTSGPGLHSLLAGKDTPPPVAINEADRLRARQRGRVDGSRTGVAEGRLLSR
jgi:hypothetical protein